MKPLSDFPLTGEWFCFPQSVVPVDKYNLDKERPWIVGGSGAINIDVHILLRSTKSGYGVIQHEPHNGTCCSDTCRIDELGWICEYLCTIELKHFTLERKSCKEPCETIICHAMKKASRENKQQAIRYRKPRKRR